MCPLHRGESEAQKGAGEAGWRSHRWQWCPREGRARGNGDRPEDGGWHAACTPDVSAPVFAPAHPACLPAPSPGGGKQALEVGAQWGEEGSGFAGTTVTRTSLTLATAGGKGRWAGGSGASKNQTF